jgi:polyphenol oxidase
MNDKSSHPPMIEAAPLTDLDGIRHGFFTREGGVSDGIFTSLNCGFGSSDRTDAVAENRHRVTTALGADADRLTTVYQVHGTAVVPVQRSWRHGDAPKADGMVTNQSGVVLGILTADCAPVLFADAQAGVIGACHAGWRGALDGIVEATIAAMERLGARREAIQAATGPTIAQDSYQVGPEFRDRFVKARAANNRFFQADDEDRFRFDLPGYVSERLQESRIGWIESVGCDTCAETSQFFSYRRSTLAGEQDFGRALSAIALQRSQV